MECLYLHCPVCIFEWDLFQAKCQSSKFRNSTENILVYHNRKISLCHTLLFQLAFNCDNGQGLNKGSKLCFSFQPRKNGICRKHDYISDLKAVDVQANFPFISDFWFVQRHLAVFAITTRLQHLHCCLWKCVALLRIIKYFEAIFQSVNEAVQLFTAPLKSNNESRMQILT